MIEVVNLSKSYGTKAVLHQINFSCNSGKVYGFVGENGAGKTTLFKCIAGLESYDGMVNCSLQNLRYHLGFLPTQPYFLSKMTGREYLQLLCNARKVEEKSFDQKNIFDLPLDEYAFNYSTGMKKKLALSGLLLQKNELFILDEPFNGVDIQSNILISDIIKKLKELGKTILISSHIFSTLSNSCDEIHLLKGGRISKSVNEKDFNDLESELKSISLGNRLDRLQLD